MGVHPLKNEGIGYDPSATLSAPAPASPSVFWAGGQHEAPHSQMATGSRNTIAYRMDIGDQELETPNIIMAFPTASQNISKKCHVTNRKHLKKKKEKENMKELMHLLLHSEASAPSAQ